MIKDHDIVRVTRDFPALGVAAGSEGTVVMIYGPLAVEVEFADSRGVTQSLVTLPTDALEVTWSANDLS